MNKNFLCPDFVTKAEVPACTKFLINFVGVFCILCHTNFDKFTDLKPSFPNIESDIFPTFKLHIFANKYIVYLL